MRISVAPYLPIILKQDMNTLAFENLCLLELPQYVTLYVNGDWNDILLDSNILNVSYETYRLLLELSVVAVVADKKALQLKVVPDVVSRLDQESRDATKQQLYALLLAESSKKIFAGARENIEKVIVSSDHSFTDVDNYNPYGKETLLHFIDRYLPRLEQLKHYHNERKSGHKGISAFSAYDKNDENYAKHLLMVAFAEHPGDVTDRTYLYTYDKKNRTFVEFRPGRNNVYHGMDISLEDAKRKSPFIVSKYHK